MLTEQATQYVIDESTEYTSLLAFQDLVIRALRNPKLSPLHTCLYIALVDTYPGLLRGEKTEIEAWRLRENAGWASKASATRFFQDMSAIHAFTYDPGKYDKKTDDRVGSLTPNPDVFPYPEMFDTNSTDRKRKAREAEGKRRNQFKDPRKLMQCPECGSEDLFFDVVAHCKCGYVAEPIRDIPASEIIIEAEIIEAQDDFSASFLDAAPTIPRLAVVPALPVTPAPAPAPLGKHPRGIPCPDCQAREHWRPEPTTWGGTIYVCALCNP